MSIYQLLPVRVGQALPQAHQLAHARAGDLPSSNEATWAALSRWAEQIRITPYEGLYTIHHCVLVTDWEDTQYYYDLEERF